MPGSNTSVIAWRLFWRELRRGELWVIAFALILAVTAVVSLSGITQSVKSALQQRSAQFVAADKVLRSSQPFNADILALAETLNLKSAQQMRFDSMLFAGDNMQLVTVKAVSGTYPLRGQLQLRRSVHSNAGTEAKLVPGEVWLESRLFDLLQVKPGDNIELGMATLTIGGVIAQEPDAPLSVFGGAPRIILHLDDIAATEVVQPGSRIAYRYLFAGEASALELLEQQLTPRLSAHERWQKIDRQTAIGSALERAERFLLLAGLLGIVLAACAAAVAAGRYSERHTQAVAIVKALGATTSLVRWLYGSHLVLVVLFSIIVGVIVGQLAVLLAQQGIGHFLAEYQPQFSWRPIGLGMLTCVICALLFAVRPMWRLTNTAAIDVLKQPALTLPFDKLQLATGALAIWALMWLFSGELLLSAGLFMVCGIFILLAMGVAALLVRLVKPIAAGQHSARRLALANLRRRLWANSFQLVTFSLAIFLALLLYFLRSELISQWQKQIPAGAPNQFLVNITEQQRSELQQFAHDHNLTLERFYPVVRGRLVAVNDEKLQQEATKENRSEQRVGVGRELNLTWVATVPDNNEVVQGKWFNEAGQAEVSAEAELAERLALQLGDKLRFSVGGQQVDATLTSIRKVDWNSLQPNFYMILSPELLADFPATYITAFYLNSDRSTVLNQLARQLPTVTVISVDLIINQVAGIISQVTVALSFILIIIGLAAALVLIAQVQATLEQREQELAILRTLGAQYAFLRNALLLEFAFLGALAGIFATVLAEAILLVLQQRVFELAFQFHYTLWWLGPVLGVCVVTLLGWWQIRRLLRIPGAQLMRKVMQG